jgi:hypothetical protein
MMVLRQLQDDKKEDPLSEGSSALNVETEICPLVRRSGQRVWKLNITCNLDIHFSRSISNRIYINYAPLWLELYTGPT